MFSLWRSRPKLVARYYLQVRALPGPQGSKSFKGMRNGKAVLVESSKKVAPWREHVKATAMADRLKRGMEALEGPVFVSMTITLPKPVNAPKTRITWPSKMPDLSKLARSTEDALTDAGIWRDDAQVVEYLRLAKVYPMEGEDALEVPGATIIIYGLDPNGAY